MRKREGIESRNWSVIVGADILWRMEGNMWKAKGHGLLTTYRDHRPLHVSKVLLGT